MSDEQETLNGLPIRRNEENQTLALRSGWGVQEDYSYPWPGDVIECPPGLASYDARYLERYSMFTDVQMIDGPIEEGDPIVVEAVDPDHHVQPCAFCSPEALVTERGVIDSDYQLRDMNGNLLAFVCIACVHDAPRVEIEE